MSFTPFEAKVMVDKNDKPVGQALLGNLRLSFTREHDMLFPQCAPHRLVDCVVSPKEVG